MKKKLFLLLFLSCVLFLSQSTCAMDQPPLTTGYNDTGIYYEVYELETSFAITTYATASSVVVSRQFKFQGMIVPPKTQEYVEVIRGTTYRGTIKLASFTYENGNTLAHYTGMLTSVN